MVAKPLAKAAPYFAYGSNLCLPRFSERVPSAKFLAIAKLANFRVVFHKRSDDGSGKATLLETAGAEVYGALFSFEDADLPALRKAEGYPTHHEERPVKALALEAVIDAMTYVATKGYYDGSQVPYDWYVELIRAGGRCLGIPEEYISQFDTLATKRDINESRSNRERAYIYGPPKHRPNTKHNSASHHTQRTGKAS